LAGLDIKRLALIHSRIKNEGVDEHVYGTGYFVTKDLVLTASHVLSRGQPEKIEIRLEVPFEGHKSHWVDAERKPVWENAKLDAALVRVVHSSLEDIPHPEWGEMSFQQNQVWESVAYPKASSEKTQAGLAMKTSGLTGKLYAHGGGGQGIPDLELGVEDEPKWWDGISGAPVFVQGKLVGIVKESLTSYEQRRLSAVPIELLRRDPSFRVAIAPKWIHPFPHKTWILILRSETGYSEIGEVVRAAIKSRTEDIERTGRKPLEDEPRIVSVSDALASPERLFQFTEAICAAPVMVFDVTNFEPAVMMFLGIRAVVRRGVTLTTTAEIPDESFLSDLPFNIQETKLIPLSGEHEITSPRYSVNWIGDAIVKGLTQLQSHPNYLDLPAYNAVRCPEPKDFAGKPLAKDKVLMLCSFHKDYKAHWRYISDKITLKAAPKTLERMLDIASPRLVGLALYESIRWTPCCIIDWTHWRANVFFELGVRLACSDIGPICLIEKTDELPRLEGESSGETITGAGLERDMSPLLSQRNQLIKLLAPIDYKLRGPIEPFDRAFKRYDAIINNQDVPIDDSVIAHNAIYHAIVKSFYWEQEPISKFPHEELSANVQAQVGKDPQKQGRSQVLFSSNPEFAKELRRNVQERWIAAWFYLKGRYSMEEFRSNADLRLQLTTLGEEAAQWLSKTPDYKRIYEDIIEVIDELGDQ